MRCKIFITLSILSFFIAQTTFAQFRLPTFDIEVKANQNLIIGEGRSDGELMYLETTNLHAGVHLQFGQRLALGVFYSKSFRGTESVSYGDGQNDQTYDALTLIKGIDLRFSGGRARKWRPYVSGTISRIEAVQDNGSFRLAGKSMMFGFNVGFMRRLSNSLYLNVIELGMKAIPDKMFWFDDSSTGMYMMLDAKMGLTYNIGKRK